MPEPRPAWGGESGLRDQGQKGQALMRVDLRRWLAEVNE